MNDMRPTTEIIWQDPPARSRPSRRSVWLDRLEPLRERPGEWARVFRGTADSASGNAYRLRCGRLPVPPGRWEFVMSTIPRDPDNYSPHRYGEVYARFLGD